MKMPSQQRTSTSIPTQSATGFTMQVDAVPVAAVMCGTRLVTAWGDGSVRRFAREQAPDRVQVHDGAILTLAADATGGLLSGGDDGVFAHLDATGQQVLARFPGQWVEHVAASADGHYACAVGRQVHLWRTDGSTQVMDHPSSVGGIAFDPNGQRLAVTHYGGATVWTHAPGDWTPTPLACRGSHLGVTWSPDGRFVVSSMQETALHGWRVGDALQLHIAGYATKVRQWCWVGTKPWLASSGATSAVLWPFDGINGPMQRAPLTLFDTPQQDLVSALCTLPDQPRILAGRTDGSVLLGEPAIPERWHVLRPPGNAAVALLAILPEPHWLLVVHDDGQALWMPLLLP
ncbi:WD40 repeat domain-containing protein [Xanthomonas albilineans]|uniref:WD40 repeat domain-containing protein n=1 Tax=Xanthomonas albilineans TaxID=29447 RepID=UPI000697FF40|nr:hypothetical protein [Xanthomonas albilineans]